MIPGLQTGAEYRGCLGVAKKFRLPLCISNFPRMFAVRNFTHIKTGFIVKTSGDFTKSARKEDIQPKWWVVDANGQTLGRIASQVASILRGKHKPSFTSHVDCGDYVIVLNAEKVAMKGKREEQKTYFHHTGYPGGEKYRTFKELIKTKPEEVIELAVKGMLPKNSLGKQIGMKLKVFRGDTHNHAAQKPEHYELKY